MKNTYTAKVHAELQALENMSESEINYDDIPQQKDWSGAEKGKFYRPIKERVTTWIDADILHWLKSGGKGYQTRMNTALREVMLNQQDRKKREFSNP